MKYIFYFSFSILIIFFQSCEEKVVMKYEDSGYLYFDLLEQKDSVLYSFFLEKEDKVRDTVWVDVKVMGLVSDRDRAVQAVQLNTGEADAAEAGKHYIAFDDPELQKWMRIEAGKTGMRLPVVILRDLSLKQQTVRIQFGFKENEFFGSGIENQDQFIIKITDQTEKPLNWSSWQPYFGDWSSLKMKFIINYVGFNEFETLPEKAMCLYLQLKAREQLEAYNAKHADEPLCEDHNKGENCNNCIIFP